MSTPQNIKSLVSENDVQQYLRDHSDFFQTNTQLLSDLHIPHDSGKAVSLVERQVSVLRDQKIQLKKQLQELVQIAKENDVLNRQLHSLTIELFRTDSVDGVIDLVQKTVRREYGIDKCQFVLYKGAEIKSASPNAKIISKREKSYRAISAVVDGKKPVCGRFNKELVEALFEDSEDVKSIALLPLAGENVFGMLALGSYDAQRFHAGKGTDFLNRLSELLGCAMRSRKQ